MTSITCRGCDSRDAVRVLDLGRQPASDHFPPATDPCDDERWALELWFCRSCALVQLGPVTARLPEPPLAVESETSRRHAEACGSEILLAHNRFVGSSVLEFASHHGGSWLDHLVAAGCRPVSRGQRANLVLDVHALAHEQELGVALAERAQRLAPEGLLVLEFHHLLPLLVGTQFDTVRHGHWSYLSLTALWHLAQLQGLQVVSATTAPVFGGSLMVLLAHEGEGALVDPSVQRVLDQEKEAGLDDPAQVATLQTTAHKAATGLHEYLRNLRARGQSVLGYGAPSKAAVLLGLSHVSTDLLPFTVDAASSKHGRRIPGCRVPIRPVDDLRAARPDVVLVLTWDIADEVVAQLEADGGWGALYVVPLPEPHVIPV